HRAAEALNVVSTGQDPDELQEVRIVDDQREHRRRQAGVQSHIDGTTGQCVVHALMESVELDLPLHEPEQVRVEQTEKANRMIAIEARTAAIDVVAGGRDDGAVPRETDHLAQTPASRLRSHFGAPWSIRPTYSPGSQSFHRPPQSA